MSELEKRITELETLVAFHEQTLEALSSVMHEQHKMIDDLLKRLGQAENTLGTFEPGATLDPADESPPPHY